MLSVQKSFIIPPFFSFEICLIFVNTIYSNILPHFDYAIQYNYKIYLHLKQWLVY